MTAIEPTPSADKSKTLATWIAIVGGSLGLHRFYLHGFRDIVGWLHPLPTLIGLYGVQRARSLGQDDQLAWVLIPFVGVTIAASMLCAIVYGLASDDKWNARFNGGRAASRSGWGLGARGDGGAAGRRWRADGDHRLRRPALLRVPSRGRGRVCQSARHTDCPATDDISLLTGPRPGITASGSTAASGSSTKARSCIRGCGTVSVGVAIC